MLTTGAKCLLVDQALESTFIDVGHESYATIKIPKESTRGSLANASPAWDNWLHTMVNSTEEQDNDGEAQATCIYMHTSGSTGMLSSRNNNISLQILNHLLRRSSQTHCLDPRIHPPKSHGNFS